MNKFLKSVFIFFLPIIFGLFILFLFLNILSFSVIKSEDNYKFNEKSSIIFLGDSHITHSIIDSRIPNSINLATDAEPYYYTYQKLKFLSKMIKLDKVILGFSYHNTSSYYDNLITGSSSANLSQKIFFCLSNFEKLRIFYWNKSKLIYLFKNIFLSYKNKKNLFADGYVALKSDEKMLTTYLIKRINEQYYNNNQVSDYCYVNLYYLNEIIIFCTKNNIELFLLTTPLNKEYIKKIPKKFKKKYNKIINDNNLNLINLQNLELNDSCYAYDGDHVTNKGAIKVTLELINSMKKL